MKNKIRTNSLIAILFVIIGLGAGWLLFHNENSSEGSNVHEHDSSSETTFTCSMHPQIRQNEPGDCPICGMELIPVGETIDGPDKVSMSPDAARLADISATKIGYSFPEKELRLQGKVTIDERLMNNQTSHIPGRIEQLKVSFTGEEVVKGQTLASIYSPELVTAQKELFEAQKSRDINPALYKAARNKLRQWKLSEKQIDSIEASGEVQDVVDIQADNSGVVLERKVSVGDYVKSGQVLFKIADLHQVWILFDAYESDIPWIRKGDSVEFTVGSIPNQVFSEIVTFIDPMINPSTRTASVRVEASNSDGLLKPEMFTNGLIKTKLALDTAQLSVPKTAVLWTGKRSVVYVSIPDAPEPTFEFREVDLGYDLGNFYIVESGLDAGEMVVTHGAFKVDAAAQLAGKRSMMNKEGGNTMTGHDHGNVNSNSSKEELTEVDFNVRGNCEMCQERIEGAAMSMNGVQHASWGIDSKILRVHFDSTKAKAREIGELVAKAGHDNEYGTAADAVYDDLPGCCQYERE